MRRKLYISVAANLVLALTLVVQVITSSSELKRLVDSGRIAEDIHMGLHAKSLEALGRSDTEVVEQTTRQLANLLEAHERNRQLQNALSK